MGSSQLSVLITGHFSGASKTIQIATITEVHRCLDVFREAGSEVEGNAGVFTSIISVEYGGKKNITINHNQTSPIGGLDRVFIVVGNNFQPTQGASVTTAVKRCLEVWNEKVGRKNTFDF